MSFSIKKEDEKLIIFKDKKEVLSLSKGDEVLKVSNGKNSFSMSRGSFNIKEEADKYESAIIEDIEDGIVKTNKGNVLISEKGGIIHVSPQIENYNRMIIRIPATKDEGVYGAGETFSEFNLRGQKFNVWVAEHQNASQLAKKLIKHTLGFKDSKRKMNFAKYETYYAQPTFISSNNYFFHSSTTMRSEFDFKNDNYYELKFDGIDDFYIGCGNDFEETLSLLTSIIGRQDALPDWTYDGEILGVQGGTDIMMQKVQTALDHGMKVNGVWIQDWEGRRVTAVGKQLFWNWQWDEELYPRLDEKIKELSEKGIKVLGYINPFLAVEKPLYKEASEKGYCVKNAQGEDYMVTITTFPAAMVDLTNPDAVEWTKNLIKENMIGLGLYGWMADFGEYLPTDAVLFSGENAEEVHNTWPVRWAKLNREAVKEAGMEGKIMFFTRAGFTGTAKYSTMMWNGDNHVDYSLDHGLPSVIPAMMSLTCSGFGLSHSDIGGYTTFMSLKRSPELYMRWCEMNAFSPMLRGHEGLNPDINAQLDANEEVLEHGKLMSNIHIKLKPYLQMLDKENHERGIGIVRPLFFYYDDEKSRNESYEYLLGRNVLVAPVIERNKEDRLVFLPDDEWIHIQTHKNYPGGEFKVHAPLGKPPVFVRKNAPKEVLDILLNLY